MATAIETYRSRPKRHSIDNGFQSAEDIEGNLSAPVTRRAHHAKLVNLDLDRL
jgi:hypothetical protein